VCVCGRLREYSDLYDVMKNERNKCVSLIAASTQKATEVREKLNIFDNEQEILRTAIALKEKYAGLYTAARSTYTVLRPRSIGSTDADAVLTALPKLLNRSRCCLGCGLRWAQGTIY